MFLLILTTILLGTGLLVCAVGWSEAVFFRNLHKGEGEFWYSMYLKECKHTHNLLEEAALWRRRFHGQRLSKKTSKRRK